MFMRCLYLSPVAFIIIPSIFSSFVFRVHMTPNSLSDPFSGMTPPPNAIPLPSPEFKVTNVFEILFAAYPDFNLNEIPLRISYCPLRLYISGLYLIWFASPNCNKSVANANDPIVESYRIDASESALVLSKNSNDVESLSATARIPFDKLFLVNSALLFTVSDDTTSPSLYDIPPRVVIVLPCVRVLI